MALIKGMTYEPIPNIGERFAKKKQQSKPIIDSVIVKETTVDKQNDISLDGFNMDFSNLVGNDLSVPLSMEDNKSSSKNKKKSKAINTTGIIAKETDYNAPYKEQYSETDAILKTAIAQVDIGIAEVKSDLDDLRRAKSLRNKYQLISFLQGNLCSFINQKITVARELNNTITKCNEMELKRSKEMKMLDNKDDDKMIMDMYNALISTPIGGQTGISTAGLVGPSTLEMTYAGAKNQTMPPNIITGTSNEEDTGYQNYMANRTPAQNLMMADVNPNIQQVYVYNKATGQSYFDVIDVTTGQSHPEIDRLDASFLEDTHPDFSTGIATNTNIGESYPIITVGNDTSILNEY